MWAAVLIVPLLMIVAFAVMSVTSRRPKTLGVREGRLAPCPDSPNCVSTLADREHQRMAAISLTGDAAEAMQALKRVVSAMPRTQIVTAEDNYLHVEFTSRLFRFVDDVEFFLDRDQGVIHFRSASRPDIRTSARSKTDAGHRRRLPTREVSSRGFAEDRPIGLLVKADDQRAADSKGGRSQIAGRAE